MKKDLKKQIMKSVNKGEIKKRSQSFFKFVKIAILVLLVALGVVASYSFNLMLYLPKRANFATPAPEQRLMHFFDIIPWPIVLVGSAALFGMIVLYRKYEGGYKVHLKWIIIIASLITIISGYVVYASNLNDRLDQRPGIRKFHDYSEQEFIPKGRRLRKFNDQKVRGKFHKFE